jgi:hypothetical protein
MGARGVQGPEGTVGNIWASQPTVSELAEALKTAAADLHPRTLLDPRHAFRYVTTVASRAMQLQGALLLRTLLAETPAGATSSGASGGATGDPEHAGPLVRSLE